MSDLHRQNKKLGYYHTLDSGRRHYVNFWVAGKRSGKNVVSVMFTTLPHAPQVPRGWCSACGGHLHRQWVVLMESLLNSPLLEWTKGSCFLSGESCSLIPHDCSLQIQPKKWLNEEHSETSVFGIHSKNFKGPW